MKLEDQVISLEIAKKLKELGVEKESLYGWFYYWKRDRYIEDKTKPMFVTSTGNSNSRKGIPAYTASELAEMLPNNIQIESSNRRYSYFIEIHKGATLYVVSYVTVPVQYLEVFNDESLANALGKMLIYLLENKLVPGRKEGA